MLVYTVVNLDHKWPSFALVTMLYSTGDPRSCGGQFASQRGAELSVSQTIPGNLSQAKIRNFFNERTHRLPSDSIDRVIWPFMQRGHT